MARRGKNLNRLHVCGTCGKALKTAQGKKDHFRAVHSLGPSVRRNNPGPSRPWSAPDGANAQRRRAAGRIPSQRELREARHANTMAFMDADDARAYNELASTDDGFRFLEARMHPMYENLGQVPGIPDATPSDSWVFPQIHDSKFIVKPNSVTSGNFDCFHISLPLFQVASVTITAASGQDFNDLWVDSNGFRAVGFINEKLAFGNRKNLKSARTVARGFSMKQSADGLTNRGMHRGIHYPLQCPIRDRVTGGTTPALTRTMEVVIPVTPDQMIKKDQKVGWTRTWDTNGHYGLGGQVQAIDEYVALDREDYNVTEASEERRIDFLSSDGVLLCRITSSGNNNQGSIGLTSADIDWSLFGLVDNMEATSVFFAGQAVNSELTMTEKRYYEAQIAGDSDNAFAHLATTSPALDKVALDAVVELSRNLPMDLPGYYNGLGDLFKKIGSIAKGVVQGIFKNRKAVGGILSDVGSGLSAMPGPIGWAARGAAGAGSLLRSL